MQQAMFDIWSGTADNCGEWLETVAGLENARKRMKEIAMQAPGPYFIFSAWNGYIIDEIDVARDSVAALETETIGAR
jgi:hypothetical protein